MEQVSGTYITIRNHTCIICGADFSTPRAGKLYCSNRCKQFSFYHKGEIQARQNANMGISETRIILKLKDFIEYNNTVALLTEIRELRKRRDSTYLTFDGSNDSRLNELEAIFPEDLKNLLLRKLSLEKWTFIKAIYPHLKKKDLYKVISGLDIKFFVILDQINEINKGTKPNPIRLLFEMHLEKLIQGKIKIV